MFKFILILILVVFLAGRLFKFLLKYAFIGMAQKHAAGAFNQGNYNGSQNKNTNASSETANSKDKKFHSGRTGGDYIDYEVVK